MFYASHRLENGRGFRELLDKADVSSQGRLYPCQLRFLGRPRLCAKLVTVIAGDFNTDPTDPRFAPEQTFSLLRQNFAWASENVPLAERITLLAKGRYPDASFDGFLIRGARAVACESVALRGVSDHFPVILTFGNWRLMMRI